MKYTLVVMLFLGLISQTEAVQLNNPAAPPQQSALQVAAHQKVDEAKAKAEASKKKVEDLKAKMAQPANVAPIAAPAVKAEKKEKTHAHDNANIQTGAKESGVVVSIESIKKPNIANKAQELAAMEEALKKATEEAHKQRIALTGETD